MSAAPLSGASMDRPPINPKNSAAVAVLVAACNPDAPLLRAYAAAETWRLRQAMILNTCVATGTGYQAIGRYQQALDQERGALRDFLKATPRTIDQGFLKLAVLLLDHEAGTPWYLRHPGERFDLLRDQIRNLSEFR